MVSLSYCISAMISAALRSAHSSAQLNELTQLDASHLEARKANGLTAIEYIGRASNVREMLMRLNELTGQALHLSVETNALYELHGSLPHRSGRRCSTCSGTEEMLGAAAEHRTTLPDGIHASSYFPARLRCQTACEQVEQMRAELASLVDTLSEGEHRTLRRCSRSSARSQSYLALKPTADRQRARMHRLSAHLSIPSRLPTRYCLPFRSCVRYR